MMLNALHRLPALETAEVKMLLNGPESFTPDGAFMLGETAETRGLFLGTGMNSVGVASGGGAGMHLAHCILHGRTAYDLGEADAKRFAPVFDGVEHLMARAPEVLGTHYEIAYPGRQFRTARGLRRLPLDARHRAAGAQMGQVFGWERPLWYGAPAARPTFGRPDWHEAVRAEVLAAHEGAALFDLSTFGKIDVTGPDAEAFLLHACAGHVGRAPGAVIYTPVLNGRGTYESDLTAHRLGPDRYRLFTGTAAIRRDLAWLGRRAEGFDVRLADVTEAHATLALMGPEAPRIAARLGGEEVLDLGPFRLGPARLAGIEVTAARLSYVGEAGWEITCAAADAPALHDALAAEGARPAGFYTQTSMRIEKGFRAMGHELDGDIGPVAAGCAFACRKGGGYLGAEAVEAARGTGSRVVSLRLLDPGAVPLGHEPVLLAGEIVGQTTSAAYGFRVGAPVALAHVGRALPDGARVEVDIARELHPAVAVRGPLFDPEGARMRPGPPGAS